MNDKERIHRLKAALTRIVEGLKDDGHESNDRSCSGCYAVRVAATALEATEDRRGDLETL